MKWFRRIERNLAALAMAPLVEIESRGREKRLQERLQRLEDRRAVRTG